MTSQSKQTRQSRRCFIDVDYLSDPGHGNSTASSIFMSKVPEDKSRVISVLTEGKERGVIGGVKASMTATMALRLAEYEIDLEHIAELILHPVEGDTEIIRRVEPPEFSLLEMSSEGRGRMVEYGHPSIRLFRRGKPEDLHWQEKGDIYLCEVDCFPGDRLMLFTETFIGKFGGLTEMNKLMIDLLEEQPEISSRELVRGLYTMSFDISVPQVSENRNGFTAASMNLRRPRRVLVATGAPFDKEKDPELARRLSGFDGKRAICGGTTAHIIGRELEREVVLDLKTAGDEVPPIMLMEGVDIITEGTITLARAVRILEHGPGADFRPRNAAEQLVALLLGCDIVYFLVGTRINETHQDPNLPAELEIRQNVVRRIADLLERKYIKEVEVRKI
jgi:hypothetical protein